MTFLLGALTFYPLRAQQFDSLYYQHKPFGTFSSIEELNDDFYVIGRTAQTNTPQYLKGLFAKIESSGHLIYGKDVVDSIPHTYYLSRNSLKKSADGNFIAVGDKWDSLYRVFLVKLDTAGSILLYREYTYPGVSIFQAQDVVEVQGIGYLILVNATIAANSNPLAIVYRTNYVGDSVNSVVHDLNSYENPRVIRAMLNGHFMVGAGSQKASSGTPFWARTWLIEIDSMGNQVTDWIDPDATNKFPNAMQQTSDSGWIIVRQHIAYDVNNFQAFNASIVKLSSSFTKEWEIDTGDASAECGLYDVEILPDGKYIACGTKPISGNDSAYRFGWIMKIDLDGTILWDRTYIAYERFGTHSYLYDIDVLANGDLLACGELRFTYNVGITPIQQGWILRLDSNGCLIDNCVVGIDEPVSHYDSFQIYPNPATDRVTVKADFELTGGMVTVYEATGRVVITNVVTQSQPTLDISGLQPGLYVISVEKGDITRRTRMMIE